jgi:methionine-rich copper-binding protein CopC
MHKKSFRKLALALSLITVALFSISSQAAAHTTVDKENSTPQPAEIVTDLKEIRLVFKSPLIDDGKAKISLATVREGQDIPIGETTFESPTVISADILQTPKPGQYVIRYVVTAEDGDINDGGYAFELYEKQVSSKPWYFLGAALGILLVSVFLLRAYSQSSNKDESDE